jgi:hypothetical protein
MIRVGALVALLVAASAHADTTIDGERRFAIEVERRGERHAIELEIK